MQPQNKQQTRLDPFLLVKASCRVPMEKFCIQGSISLLNNRRSRRCVPYPSTNELNQKLLRHAMQFFFQHLLPLSKYTTKLCADNASDVIVAIANSENNNKTAPAKS